MNSYDMRARVTPCTVCVGFFARAFLRFDTQMPHVKTPISGVGVETLALGPTGDEMNRQANGWWESEGGEKKSAHT